MPGKTNINLTIFLVSTVLFSISCSQRNHINQTKINEEISVNAASIKDIPVGLKAMVPRVLPDTTFNVWIPGGSFRNSSLVRVPRFPEKINAEKNQNLELKGVRNEQISAQLAVISSSTIQDLRFSVSALTSEKGQSPPPARIRFVKFMPVGRDITNVSGDFRLKMSDIDCQKPWRITTTVT